MVGHRYQAIKATGQSSKSTETFTHQKNIVEKYIIYIFYSPAQQSINIKMTHYHIMGHYNMLTVYLQFKTVFQHPQAGHHWIP